MSDEREDPNAGKGENEHTGAENTPGSDAGKEQGAGDPGRGEATGEGMPIAGAGQPDEIDMGRMPPRPRPGFGARRPGAAAAPGTRTEEAARRPTASATRSALGGVNDKTKRRQQVLLAGVGGVALLACSYFIMGGEDHKKTSVDPDLAGRQEVPISTEAMVNKVEDQKTWMAQSGNRLNMQDGRIKVLEGEAGRMAQLQDQIEALKSQNQEIRNNGASVIAAYERENQNLRSGAGSAAPSPEPFRAGGAGAPTYGQAGGFDQVSQPRDMGPPPSPAEVKVISFTPKGEEAPSAGRAIGSARPDASPVVVEDSPEYLPPNSYAPARVIVGVDASAGVNSQTDPLPVVLRITGPARSVMQRGRVLTTRIQGCVINGAARGDLSAEKVYVKLAKMTCDQPGGRVAVSEVKGFISFAGKAGVRGRVVSREGSLVGQALLAGIAGGFGRGFSANTNAALSGLQVTTNGRRPELGAGDIVKGGLGNGVAEAGDMVSKYLIERAEQYQPVIEMPTGIDVEIVFLDGAYVRTPR